MSPNVSQLIAALPEVEDETSAAEAAEIPEAMGVWE